MDSFTITCDKCGCKRTLIDDSCRYGNTMEVSINAVLTHSYSGSWLRSIDIDCDNPNCNNSIEIK